MDLTIKGRHWTPTTSFKSFAIERVQKLGRFYPNLIRAELVITREGYRHHAELLLKGNSLDLLTKGEDTDPKAAVDMVVEKSERALERRKDRLKDQKKRGTVRGESRRSARGVEAMEVPAPLPRPRSSVQVVREAAKCPPMSAEDAAKRLLKGSKPFLLFTEPGAGVRLAYRRGDREVGVLELD
ncbi:MAG TPA: ribosome-associated translation inhibitor RaiA [Candidatus Eisenbacteria bacterium]|nr:ribosome-associated translation inhibitor RaiA [Candidatus Eisenbacteria bacterium]